MQAIFEVLHLRNCCVTLIFPDVVPQLKFSKLFICFHIKTSLLPCLHSFNTLFSFQGAMSSTQTPYHATSRKRHVLFISLCFLFLAKLVSLGGGRGLSDALLRSEISTQFLKYLFPSLILVLVGPSGLEPPTLRLSVARSSQLSYGPIWWR
jgi:hypothetical protein